MSISIVIVFVNMYYKNKKRNKRGLHMIFAYTRISTNKESQKTDRQIDTLKRYAAENQFSFDRISEERISGNVKGDNRPVYSDLKKGLRNDDILVLTDLDRLGRNADDTIQELKDLKSLGVRVVILDIPYMNEWAKVQDSSIYAMIIDILITLKAHIAQQEREKMQQRINQGLAAAKENGVRLGRPEVILPKGFIKEYEKYKSGGYGDITATAFARMLNIGRSTLYKYINLYENIGGAE